MFTLTFNKTFISGILVGLTIQESMPFVSRLAAMRWVEGVNGFSKRNGYTVAVIA